MASPESSAEWVLWSDTVESGVHRFAGDGNGLSAVEAQTRFELLRRKASEGPRREPWWRSLPSQLTRLPLSFAANPRGIGVTVTFVVDQALVTTRAWDVGLS